MKLLERKLRRNLYVIIFGTSTPAGRLFDLVLLYTIIISLVTVMLESVGSLNDAYGQYFRTIEWIVTVLFTLEYLLRIYVVDKPKQYIFSFLGIIDFLSFFPTYFIFFFPGMQFMLVLRVIRLLRVFRVLKLNRYIIEIQIITRALKESRYKIFVFMLTVFTIVLLVGTLMYMIEGPENGFSSIPESIYWAVVTITTVGYGDIAPGTVLGKFLASLLMFIGYSILAVPTGIVTIEYSRSLNKREGCLICIGCHSEDHEFDAQFCKHCGGELKPEKTNRKL